MIGISLEGIALLVPRVTGRSRVWLVRVTATMALAGIVYPYPLWSGAVMPDHRSGLPAAYVRLPAAWTSVAGFINHQPVSGKVLILPLNDFYEMPTTWGYYGVDLIPRSLLARPTIQGLPGSYYVDLPAFRSLTSSVQSALLSGDRLAVPRLLDALGVRFIVVRRDIDLSYFDHSLPPRHVADPGQAPQR